MEPNQNPPSERAWSIAEQEEFFASQDAITGATISNAPFRENWFLYPAGIHVTHIVPPTQGWPIAMHCPLCKETTFLLSPWAAKPEKGDYWRMTETCARSDQHNMELAMKPLKPLAYRPLPGGYMDATGPHRGDLPSLDVFALHSRMMFGPYDAVIEQEMSIEEAKRRFPNTPRDGQEKI
jgi:hypothetical protein